MQMQFIQTDILDNLLLFFLQELFNLIFSIIYNLFLKIPLHYGSKKEL